MSVWEAANQPPADVYVWDEITGEGQLVPDEIWDSVAPDSDAQEISNAIDRLQDVDPPWGEVHSDAVLDGGYYRIITVMSERAHESVIFIVKRRSANLRVLERSN